MQVTVMEMPVTETLDMDIMPGLHHTSKCISNYFHGLSLLICVYFYFASNILLIKGRDSIKNN